jgi:hypothetical protein
MAVYALVAAVVLGVNLLPAFGPPTWAVLVWFEVTHDLDPVAPGTPAEMVVYGDRCG